MIGREILTTFLSVLLMLIAIGYVSAADYYVCVGGDGAEDGSNWANAFAEIQKAVDACVSGADTIHVADGTYMAVSNGGDQTYPIDIDSKTGISMIGHGERYYGPWLQGDGQTRMIVIEDSSGITIRNFKVSDGYASGDGGGIWVLQTDGVLLADLEVTEITCQGEDTTYTGNGGAMAFDFSTVDVVGCCIWKNYALAHDEGWGGNGGAIALFNPDWDSSERGYWIRDCCIFWNEADDAGGGIFLSGNDGYSLIENLTTFGFAEDPVDSSVVYRYLREMEEDALVASEWDTEASAGPARRVYRITEEGDRALAWWVASLQETDRVLHRFLQAYCQHMKEDQGEHYG